jgi:hypothetical protein
MTRRFNLFSERVPWTLIVFAIALWLPWIGTRYDTLIGTQILIYALFASSLNLLLGASRSAMSPISGSAPISARC